MPCHVLGKPKLRGESDALQLAGRALRYLFEEHYLPRHFEIREALADEVAQLLLRRAHAIAQHHGGGDVLAKLVVGHGEGDDLLHRRVIHQPKNRS